MPALQVDGFTLLGFRPPEMFLRSQVSFNGGLHSSDLIRPCHRPRQLYQYCIPQRASDI